MKLSLSFPELSNIRERIGAPLTGWRPGSPVLDPRQVLLAELREGVEIALSDIVVGPGRLLTYKGEQVLLYIKDTRASQWTLENAPEDTRRFHVADCSTLNAMREAGRFERYVVTNRMDGYFKVDWLDPDTRERGETESALKVCKNCLKSLNWRGYDEPTSRLQLHDGSRQSKGAIWQEFAIAEFLAEYATFFRARPSRRDTEADHNVYVASWPQISEQKRRAAGWRCQGCTVLLEKRPGLLHVHHKNGVVTDNAQKNLIALCIECHAEQPFHGHMKVPSSAHMTLERLRREQSLARG